MFASSKNEEYRIVLQEMFPRQGKLSAYIQYRICPFAAQARNLFLMIDVDWVSSRMNS